MRLQVKSSDIAPGGQTSDETLALMPSLLQGHASIDKASAILLQEFNRTDPVWAPEGE